MPRTRPSASSGAVDAVHIAVDLASRGVERCRERHRGGIRTASAEGEQVTVDVDALESGTTTTRPSVRWVRIRAVSTAVIRLARVDRSQPPRPEHQSTRPPVPRTPSAIASSAAEAHSPVASSWSVSRVLAAPPRGYAGYAHLPAVHAWYGAHLLRDLRSISDADPDGQLWAIAWPTPC